MPEKKNNNGTSRSLRVLGKALKMPVGIASRPCRVSRLWSARLLALEKEMVGIALSGHDLHRPQPSDSSKAKWRLWMHFWSLWHMIFYMIPSSHPRFMVFQLSRLFWEKEPHVGYIGSWETPAAFNNSWTWRPSIPAWRRRPISWGPFSVALMGTLIQRSAKLEAEEMTTLEVNMLFFLLLWSSSKDLCAMFDHFCSCYNM